jgi:hypothetical protein
VDWNAVREAFTRIGYSDSAIAENGGGPSGTCFSLNPFVQDHLRDTSNRIDKLVLAREREYPI